jgi:DNA-binding NarL/FixJ family response regulator
MLADMIQRALEERLEIETLAEIRSRHRIADRLRELRPDLVVIGLRRNEDDRVGRTILQALPGATVIAISNDLRQAFVHTMQPHRTVLDDFSRSALAAQVAQVATRI